MKPKRLDTWELDCWRPGENWNFDSVPKFSERNFLMLLERYNELVDHLNDEDDEETAQKEV